MKKWHWHYYKRRKAFNFASTNIDMKKKQTLTIFILSFLCALLALPAKSQPKIGLNLIPNISYARVDDSGEGLPLEKDGSSIKFSFGVFFDQSINDRYFFTTGINYVTKGVQVSGDTAENRTISEKYNLQYLQIPVALKLYTNEIAPDLKIYSELGLTAEIKINDEIDDGTRLLTEKFKFFDSALLLEAGTRFQLGPNTALTTGIRYSRGLINISKNDNFTVKSDMVGLVLGVKF